MPTFPSAQYRAIQREKENDRTLLLTEIADKLRVLRKQESDYNDLFYSFHHAGIVDKRDKEAVDLVMHERNALRVRINRLQKRLVRGK